MNEQTSELSSASAEITSEVSNILQKNQEGCPRHFLSSARATKHTDTQAVEHAPARARTRPRGPGALLVRNMTGQVYNLHPRPWTFSFGEINLRILI